MNKLHFLASLLWLLTFTPTLYAQHKTALVKGEEMIVGDRIYSKDDKLYFTIEAEGTAVRETETDKLVWGTNNYAEPMNTLTWIFQTDNNFCLKTKKDLAFRWCSMALTGSRLILTDEGQLRILDSGGNTVWNTPNVFKISGQIKSSDGSPVPDAQVLFNGLIRYLMHGSVISEPATTDANGEYTFYSLENSQWSFYHEDHGLVEKTITQGGPINITFGKKDENVDEDGSVDIPPFWGKESLNLFHQGLHNMQFGYRESTSSPFVPYTSGDEYSTLGDEENPAYPYLQRTFGGCAVMTVTPEAAEQDPTFAAGSFLLMTATDSGSKEKYSAIRYVAPHDGAYKVKAKWEVIANDEVKIFIETNVETPGFSSPATPSESEEQVFEFEKNITMKEGDWVEFQFNIHLKELIIGAALTLDIQKAGTPTQVEIGDRMEGGIVFDILQPGDRGYQEDNNTALVCFPQDADKLYDIYGASTYAADFSHTGPETGKTYNDWQLPSEAELKLIYNLHEANPEAANMLQAEYLAFPTGFFDFSTGQYHKNTEPDDSYHVRLVRRFHY